MSGLGSTSSLASKISGVLQRSIMFQAIDLSPALQKLPHRWRGFDLGVVPCCSPKRSIVIHEQSGIVGKVLSKFLKSLIDFTKSQPIGPIG